MGSYYEVLPDGIGAPAGGLVWVRRCNGTWWPGRILAPGELPPGCPCPPPRCKGTPIQLLGRENGTVVDVRVEQVTKRWKNGFVHRFVQCLHG